MNSPKSYLSPLSKMALCLWLSATISAAHAEGLVPAQKTGCLIMTRAADSASWQGPCAGGKANGRGVARYYKSGQLFGTYRGQMLDGVRSGSGTQEFPDGAVFVGSFDNGNVNGQGRFRHSDGTTYIGAYLDNERHGYGVLTDARGAILYKGEWIAGKQAKPIGAPEQSTDQRKFANSRNAQNIVDFYEIIERVARNIKRDPFSSESESDQVRRATEEYVGKTVYIPEGEDFVGDGKHLSGLNYYPSSGIQFGTGQASLYGTIPLGYLTETATCSGHRGYTGYSVWNSNKVFSQVKSDFGSPRVDVYSIEVQIPLDQVRNFSRESSATLPFTRHQRLITRTIP
ncbi:MAG: hypothetical protein IPP44_25010 [Ideonella sp.]|nr:hypothetical protein [Ideonella sp.]